MKFTTASVALACAALANAQYFSAGWKPGQPADYKGEGGAPGPTQVPVPRDAIPSKPMSLSSMFDISNILTLPPVAALFSQFGINITEKVQNNTQVAIWDDRVPLITDENFHELIFNEPLTEEEEAERVWFIVISGTAGKQESISKYVDQVFDSAYNETLIAGDLPNVRWGRVDYLNVTYITTKWVVWRAPFLVVAKDRGRTLRFYKAHEIRLRDYSLREFLESELWKMQPPWSTAYAPGGSREFILEFIAIWMTKIYNKVVLIPRFIMIVISGSLASVLVNVLHWGQNKVKKPTPAIQITPSPSAGTSTSTSSTPKGGNAKQRKSSRK